MTVKDFMFGLEQRFDADKVPGQEATFHFKISGEGGGDYTSTIKGGTCKVTEGLEGEADCVVTTSDTTLQKLIAGQANPAMAVMTGKLKVSNVAVMMKFAKPFGLM